MEPRKTVLVTGASRGIGRSLAVGFAKAGYDVAITDLPREEAAMQDTAALVTQAGGKAHVQGVDVSDAGSVKAAIAALLERVGRIDVLVNNAGILKTVMLDEIEETVWDAHFDVNVKGVHLMCQAVLPAMRARRSGRIINIASIAGRLGVPSQAHYAATKAAVISLARVMAREYGPEGINVNALCPGIILTEMGKNNLGTEEAVKYWETQTACRRLGQPEDIVGPAVFLASSQADFVNGQSLNVCGGLYFH
ncbi:SDR family NAD(P)-dependent oxidoreductase [Falsirhodobacter halotolerans]|uniref:SDR family NAD(P)-dependent oxidoreductase n=1 Tax=Falsirhodobacter halotolerans TaxID=1146892 RepID=UPI001FD5F926|nr:3-oxoacyl-ACP reductase family protein [Falsirhodobacter halotolerans]MCJ8139154.1 3-oxoacyl-ACP reductase FabG [Falsirhodobacter halotolerans]